MTIDTKPNLARRSTTYILGKVRRRLGWALGSAAGMLMMSITFTVIVLESNWDSSLPESSRVPIQGTFPAQSTSAPRDGEAHRQDL